MILSVHAALGAAIGAAAGNPAVVVPLALASHLGLDSFPHLDVAHLSKPMEDGQRSGEPPWWANIVFVCDGLVALAIVVICMLVRPERALTIAIGSFVAIFPDLQYAPRFGQWLSRQFWYRPYSWLHEYGHVHFPLTYEQRYWGYHPQILALIGSIAWLLHS